MTSINLNTETGQSIRADKARSIPPASVPNDESDHCGVAGEATCRVSRPSDEEGLSSRADKADVGLLSSPLIDALAELQVRRKFYISVTNKQANAAKALVRRALGQQWSDDESEREASSARAARIVAAGLSGKPQKPEDEEIAAAVAFDLNVIAAGLGPFRTARNAIELEMRKSVRKLPVYAWAKQVRGFGDLGLAVIIGEAGDLSKYPKKGHLWKRFGLAPFEGKAYSTWRSGGGLSAEQWTEAGYSPRRRAEMFAVIAEPLMKHQLIGKEKSGTVYGEPKGPYGEVYVRRREQTAGRADWTPKHAQMDAMRVMTKYLLRDIWKAWRAPDHTDMMLSLEAIDAALEGAVIPA